MKKGQTNNPAGRPAGSPNKLTRELRDFIKGVLEENQAQIIKDLKLIEPYQRLQMYERLLKFVLPTLQSIEEKKSDSNEVIRQILESQKQK